MPCFYLLSPFSQQLSFHSSIPFTSTFGSKVAVKNNTVLLTIIIRRGVHNRKTHSLTTNIRLTNIHTTVSLTQGWCLKSIISFSNGGLRVVLNKIYGDCLLSTIKTTTTASLYQGSEVAFNFTCLHSHICLNRLEISGDKSYGRIQENNGRELGIAWYHADKKWNGNLKFISDHW